MMDVLVVSGESKKVWRWSPNRERPVLISD
jgi:hypothetical protein